MIPRDEWYPRLVRWKNWEIPKPSREASAGFFAISAISLLLHLTVIWICRLFEAG